MSTTNLWAPAVGRPEPKMLVMVDEAAPVWPGLSPMVARTPRLPQSWAAVAPSGRGSGR